MNFYAILIFSLTLSFASNAQQSPCDNLPELLFDSELKICEGDSISVSPNFEGYDSFQWSDGSTDTVKWISEEGEYIIFGTYITSNQTVNGDFEAGNIGFSSEHIYNATTIWDNATYTVTTSANLVHPNLNGFGHGGSGNFMAVNGSAVVDAEIWCQTIVVEPNTIYDFSAWVSSISPTNTALLQFSIDGVLLGSPFSAPSATLTWDQFTSTWFSGTDTTIEICITNQNTVMNGNDFGLDDIEFVAYCQNTDTIEIEFVEVSSTPSFGVEECRNTFIIAPDSAVVSATTGSWDYVAPPGGPTNVIITPLIGTDSAQVFVPELGEYTFIYINGCSDTAYIIIDVISVSPELDIVAEQACDFNIDLTVSNPAVQTGTWSYFSAEGTTVVIDGVDSASTTAVVSDYGTYTFTYTFDFCEASFSQEVEIIAQAPVITVNEPYIICDRTVTNLTAQIAGQGDHWEVDKPESVIFEDDEAETTSATVPNYGIYNFYYFGCNSVDTIEIEFVKNAPHITVPSFVKCGTEAFLQVEFLGEPGNWSISNTYGDSYDLNIIDVNNASLSGDEYGEYNVQYNSCDTSVQATIVFYCDLVIPNVFTPNNDGVNQEFIIDRLDSRYYDRSELNVFNRWGIKVYHNGQYGLNDSWWDGKDSSNGDVLIEGVYYYTLNLHNHVTEKDEKYSGTINLRR